MRFTLSDTRLSLIIRESEAVKSRVEIIVADEIDRSGLFHVVVSNGLNRNSEVAIPLIDSIVRHDISTSVR